MNNVVELQAMLKVARWLLLDTAVEICSDSTNALNRMRGITKSKQHTQYAVQVRTGLSRLQSLLPANNFVWRWVKRHSS